MGPILEDQTMQMYFWGLPLESPVIWVELEVSERRESSESSYI